MTVTINKLKIDGLLPKEGKLLDLGCGAGKDSLSAAELGLKVTSVDKDHDSIELLKSIGKVKAIESKIEDFNFVDYPYDVIIANNSLPFIRKEDVMKVMKSCVSSLSKNGIFYFTIFGDRDEWMGKENMSFWKIDEITNFIKSIGLSISYQSIEEGIGATKSGKNKFWHIYRFTTIKN